MKRIFTGIAAAAVLMTSIAGASLAETTSQNPFSQSRQRIGQNQKTPLTMPGQENQEDLNQTPLSSVTDQQNQGEENQMTPPAMPGQQNQDDQNQMTPPAMPGQQNQGGENQMTPPAMPGQQNQAGQNPVMTVHTGNSGWLNMREEANMGADVIGRYKNGTQVDILEVGDEWVKVSINGKTGYMAIRFLEGELPVHQDGNYPETPAESASGQEDGETKAS